MRAKICGIQNKRDAQYAVLHGAWALGFVFYPSSPRYVTHEIANDVIQTLPQHILKIGILPYANEYDVEKVMSEVELDLLQVYQDVAISPFLKKRMILSLCVNSIDALPKPHLLEQYEYLLLDAPRVNNQMLGGTGRLSCWKTAKILAQSYRLILAGGLHAENVRFAIEEVNPYAVDVSSGVEGEFGKKSLSGIKKFLAEVSHVK